MAEIDTPSGKAQLSVSPIPLPWFLPGHVCIRAYLAQGFASETGFHRGVHLESTFVQKFGFPQ